MVKITQSTKPISAKDIKREWHLVDVKKKILGRAVSEIIQFLIGKNKINFVPYLDAGDYVVVINASKVKLSGKKSQTEAYSFFSGYPGGRRTVSFERMLKEQPKKVISLTVSGMLPKNKLRKQRLARLFVFADEKHPYEDKLKSPSFVKTTEGKQKLYG